MGAAVQRAAFCRPRAAGVGRDELDPGGVFGCRAPIAGTKPGPGVPRVEQRSPVHREQVCSRLENRPYNCTSMKTVRIAILGATGYTALELIKLLLRHPEAKIEVLTSRQEG